MKTQQKNQTVHLVLWAMCMIFINNVDGQNMRGVQVWEDSILLPTYKMNPVEKNPAFFRNESYQGASRYIYPYPAQDNLTNEKVDRWYKALYLENEYLRVCVLPELGGRLFYATDKTNGYEIFYRQSVIKPALIGMLGAWISGGVEFCVFHHHRASTYLPVDHRITRNEDGSATIWIGEYEPRHRMKWEIGISLYPGRSYIEASGTLMNTTEKTNSFLYWANVATHVNEDYQIFFPPSVDFATFHSKNSFAHWPITTEAFTRDDYYRDSIDVSWWKNHPNPTSFFAFNIKDGFLAGYDHGKEAGTVHIGNPHIVTGAKLFEWGSGERGTMWSSNVLTDHDGPYAELMSGAYSDNQPDYSWIKPYETKTFSQYWYPLREIRGCKNANLEAAVNLELTENNEVFIAVNTTRSIEKAMVTLKNNGSVLFRDSIRISPGEPFSKSVKQGNLDGEEQLELVVNDEDGNVIISYQPLKKDAGKPLPEALQPPELPENIETTEELYLTGLRIKQFHNARRDPNAYFLEALRRDSMDIRCNTQMGLYHAGNGDYEGAAFYFRRAITRSAMDYTRPRDCEPFYQLGLILQEQGDYEAAFDTLYRAAWDYEFRAASYYHLAQIANILGDPEQALELVESAIEVNGLNVRAINLKAAILRDLERFIEAEEAALQALEIDHLNFQAIFELMLVNLVKPNVNRSLGYKIRLLTLLRDHPESYLEEAVNYLNCGMTEDALMMLELALESPAESLKNYPTIVYYLGFLHDRLEHDGQAADFFRKARSLPTDYCFPFRLETLAVYDKALEYEKDDAKALYYQGNILYDRQPLKAIQKWEKAVELDPGFAIAWRNIGWGYTYTTDDPVKAIRAYENAVRFNPEDALYYYELDKLYEKNGEDVGVRLKLLQDNHENVVKREDALIREILVMVYAGEYDQALQYLNDYFFHIQEGSRELHDIWVDACLLRGLDFMEKGDSRNALNDFLAADAYPENHQIGRDHDYRRNAQIYYYTGLGYEKTGDQEKANEYYQKTSVIPEIPYEYRYYQARAMEKLGNRQEADSVYYSLLGEGQKRFNAENEVDFFAKFGQGATPLQQKAIACQLQGLAYLGLKKNSEARKMFTDALSYNKYLIWAEEYLNRPDKY